MIDTGRIWFSIHFSIEYSYILINFTFFSQFRLSYYPHRLEAFTTLLKSVFGDNSKHSVYGDFKPLEEEADPAFFIHVIVKQ